MGLLSIILTVAGVTLEEPARFALVIGHNTSDNPQTGDLRYADDDALAIHRLLLEANVSSVLLWSPDRDTARMAPNVDAPAPTLENIQHAVAFLNRSMVAARQEGGSVELLLFYSGHGDVEDGEGYIVISGGRVTRTDLQGLLRSLKSDRNHVVIDACKSYYLVFDRKAGGTRERAQGYAPLKVPLPNTGYVLSTSSDRDSHEWERYQGGVFSHEVRSALRGAADVDLDGRITYAELGAFLTTANESIVNPRFRPDFVVEPPQHRNFETPLLGWLPETRSLIVGTTESTRIHIETPGGVRLLDAHPSVSQTLHLRLPGQRPLFVYLANLKRELVLRSSSPRHLATLRKRKLRVANKGALHIAFSQLFATPFDERSVERFLAANRGVVDPVRLQVDAAPSFLLRDIAGWTALVTAGIGAASTIVAYERQQAGLDLPGTRREERNRLLDGLNVTSVVAFSIAATAAVTWLVTWIWAEPEPVGTISPGAANAPRVELD